MKKAKTKPPAKKDLMKALGKDYLRFNEILERVIKPPKKATK